METLDLGRAVFRWRNRLTAETVGVPVGARRRVAGLRREELAELAGISVDYLVRLEQGRATSPSAQVVEALARALRLTDTERELIFRLAGQAVPGAELIPTRISPSIQRLLDRLGNNPVAVFDATWTLLTANQPYNALMGDTSSWRGIEHNTLWRFFAGPGSRAVSTSAELADLEARLTSDLRMAAARYPADPRPGQLARTIARDSERFARLWEAGNIGLGGDQPRRKIIRHPDVGDLALDCDTLTVSGDGLHVMVYTAEPGSADADRLALAVVLGTQQMSAPREQVADS
ncbi:helix-turn-helix transcriptional regulator [Arthrobacter sp. zg-Y1143]|uniref:helix-turn-helix transcriptional regulator n=1 Tax=Arthrobacter sp. zg-Y1143 TaxID=3049065 RepID=UPI0024C37AC0|nr:helix-turn-helix transcriptional regulator [Arthrobacter sp. zg-Y1143]MDK1326493.1 helix-turn-helix transcriptional regulator [Arthrobacter sp. zg-Y1143]